MTEKEKCEKGLLYNANFDEELIQERNVCKILCQEYNHTDYSDFDKRKKIIQDLLRTSQTEFLIEQPFWCDYGYNIEIGANF